MARKTPELSLFVALIFLSCASVVSAQATSDWYPLEPGDTWTYQKEALEGDMANPDVERWTTEETVTSAIPISEFEGTLVTKSTKVLSDTVAPGFPQKLQNDWSVREPSESHLLVYQNCVYLLDGPDANGASQVLAAPDEWVSTLDTNSHLRPAAVAELRRGNVPPDFCFPIVKGMTWGNVPETSPDLEYVWSVTDLNADPFGLRGTDTFHLSSYLGSGTPIDRWFAKGVGVVQEIFEHHGTYDENRRQLLSATIHGHTENFELKPARTIPLSKYDCEGPGWQHFARADGTPFRDLPDCVSYSTAEIQ